VKEFDLAIVGGGIVGVATAYLARAQQRLWRTVILEKTVIGDGATRYSLALDLPFGRTPKHKLLAEQSINYYRDWKAADPDLPIYPIRFVLVVAAQDVDRVKTSFLDDTLHFADRQERFHLEADYPSLNIPPEYRILIGANARYGLPQAAACSLARKACAQGQVECWEGAEVIETCRDNGRFLIATADSRTVVAKRLVLAIGPWMTNGPATEFSRQQGVRIKKVAAIQVKHCPRPDTPVLYFVAEDAFLLPDHDLGCYWFSFTSTEWDCAPQSLRPTIAAADREQALLVLEKYGLEFERYWSETRVFCDAYAPDRTPLVAALPDTPSFVVAGACSGSGFRLAPAIAAQTLRLLSSAPQS
jgi:glycine/D-amino acid oxidase-like deaminating enzyme